MPPLPIVFTTVCACESTSTLLQSPSEGTLVCKSACSRVFKTPQDDSMNIPRQHRRSDDYRRTQPARTWGTIRASHQPVPVSPQPPVFQHQTHTRSRHRRRIDGTVDTSRKARSPPRYRSREGTTTRRGPALPSLHHHESSNHEYVVENRPQFLSWLQLRLPRRHPLRLRPGRRCSRR